MNRTKLYDKLSLIENVLAKLWCKNKNKGTVINPEKDIAFPISTTSFVTELIGLRKNWKTIRNKSDIDIAIIIFIIKSLNDKLYNLNIFKNSIGMNNIKIEALKSIKNQNKPWALQVIIFLSIRPTDSIKI